MPENIEAWWARRQRSKEREVPYAVGSYREEWAMFPMLVRQYHPDFNRMITLTQIPPAADVYLTWQCDAGHLFVATPEEQRSRPGRVRRRSAWCPVCADLASPPRIRPAPPPTTPSAAPPAPAAAAPTRASRAPAAAPPTAARPWAARARAASPPPRARDGRPTRHEQRSVATDADTAARAGEPFHSTHAPPTASAAEALLRQKLAARLEFEGGCNAVRVSRPFHGRLEVWPDIVLPELRVALEYDTVGRFGLEHVGPRETSDRSKDHVLRAAGWEVVRIRCSPLRPLGPHDVAAGSTVTDALVARVVDALRAIRGDLFVNAYLRS